MNEQWWQEGWYIPSNSPKLDTTGPRIFRLKGTRSNNGQTTWVLKLYTIEGAAQRNMFKRFMYKRLAREFKEDQKEQLTFINY